MRDRRSGDALRQRRDTDRPPRTVRRRRGRGRGEEWRQVVWPLWRCGGSSGHRRRFMFAFLDAGTPPVHGGDAAPAHTQKGRHPSTIGQCTCSSECMCSVWTRRHPPLAVHEEGESKQVATFRVSGHCGDKRPHPKPAAESLRGLQGHTQNVITHDAHVDARKQQTQPHGRTAVQKGAATHTPSKVQSLIDGV